MTGPSEESTFDAAAFFETLKRSGAEHRQVVALRPSAEQVAESFEQIGDVLSRFGEASRELAALTLGIDPNQKSGWFPLPDSIALHDAQSIQPTTVQFCGTPRASSHWLETNPTRNPVDWGLEFIVRCFKTATENLHAVVVLSDTRRHLRAPLTLMRSIIEAAATACSLMDGQVTQRERLRRALNLHLDEAKEAVLEASEPEYADRHATELKELMEFATFAGFDFRRYKPSEIAR